MASEAQIAANRRNAQRSTGPKTPEGKEKSRWNAFRHGLAAEQLVALGEDSADFARYVEEMSAALQPQDAFERALALRVATASWRLERVARLEAGILDRTSGDCAELLLAWGKATAEELEANPPADVWPEEMSKIARYEATIDREFHRATTALEKRQAARRRGELPDTDEITERSQLETAATDTPSPPRWAERDKDLDSASKSNLTERTQSADKIAALASAPDLTERSQSTAASVAALAAALSQLDRAALGP